MRTGPPALQTRLLLASAVLLPLFLGLSAWLLDLAFQRSLIAAEKERLNTHIYLLLAAAEVQDDTLWLPDEVTEPRFGQVNSGLYGVVYNGEGESVWRSPSAKLFAGMPAFEAAVNPGQTRFTDASVDGTAMFRFTYDVLWETVEGDERPYRFAVLHDKSAYRAELSAYRQQLWWLLGGLAVLLLIAQASIMRWGLRPLRTLAGRLREVEQGRADQLEGDYPEEIRPVTDNLNRVLTAERLQRERYRNTLSDLAHSLKTPLAVLRGSLHEPGDRLREQVGDQVTRMDEIVSHQLQRAVTGTPLFAGTAIRVGPVAERIAAALQKVHAAKAVRFSVVDPQSARFYGTESDLMELLGNLLDNAFKYARGKVQVHTAAGGELTITVGDDGPGVPADRCRRILDRGARADTVRPGQGIGLAVTADIVAGYGGSLDVGRSESLGGAEFTVTIPAKPPGP